MYDRPISTFFSRGRSTPEIRAMFYLALTLLVLGIAFADDASHAGALDDLAVLADRLHAAANFHRRSGLYERKSFRPDPNSSGHSNFMQVTSDQPHPSCR